MTFRERVENFWQWWTTESERIYASVDDDGGRTIEPEISQAVSDLGAEIGWVFGPGENREGHSFTLTAGGDAYRRLLIDYWLNLAPKLEGWTFYPSRQPYPNFDETTLTLGEVKIKAEALWITPAVDTESEDIDITVWSPIFEDIERDQAEQILFIFLDQALGEDGVEAWLGSIEIGSGKLEDSFPLSELPEHIDRTFDEQGWEKRDQIGVVYQIEEAIGGFPRGDIFIGSADNFKLVDAYFSEGGPIENPFKECGTDLVFIQLPRALFPDGEELAFRGGIEDALSGAFGDRSGRVLGGAIGADAGYIDLALFDGDRSREIIGDVMKARGLEDTYQLMSFVK